MLLGVIVVAEKPRAEPRVLERRPRRQSLPRPRFQQPEEQVAPRRRHAPPRPLQRRPLLLSSCCFVFDVFDVRVALAVGVFVAAAEARKVGVDDEVFKLAAVGVVEGKLAAQEQVHTHAESPLTEGLGWGEEEEGRNRERKRSDGMSVKKKGTNIRAIVTACLSVMS